MKAPTRREIELAEELDELLRAAKAVEGDRDALRRRAEQAEGEVKALQRALDHVRARAERAEGLLTVAVDVLCDRVCPQGACPAQDGVKQTPGLDRDCRPCWREELNRRLAAAQKPAADETQGR